MPTTRRHIQTNGGYQTPAVKPVISRHINRHIERVAAPKKIEASYGYQATTPAAEPTTLAAEEQTTLLSNDYYQTPAAEPTTRRHIKTTMAKPITQSYYQTTTPAAEPTTRRHIKTTMAKPITQSYYQATTPAAEPTTRRHIKTTIKAKPITQSYYQTTTPAAEPTTKSLLSGYQTKTLAETGHRLIKSNGYQAPAVKPVLHPSVHRHMKTTRVAAETTPASYGYQTTPAALLFETTTPAPELVTESSYGGYQTDNLDAEENFAAESIARRLIKADGAYLTENFAAEPTTRSRIETNYQTPAVKPVISRHINRHIERVAAPKKIEASYGYQATTPAAEPTTRKTTHVTMPTTRRHIQTNGGYQTPAVKTNVKPIAKQATYYEKHFYQMSAPLEKSFGGYQTPAAEPTTRRHIEKLTTPSYGYETTTLAPEPTTRRHIEKLTTPSYGFEATTLADDVTTESSYGGYQTTSIAEEPTTRRRFIFKKVYVDEEPTTRKPLKLQQAY